MANILRNLIRSGSAEVDPETSTYHTTPWRWRDDDGMYIGANKDAWLYRVIDTAPLLWEDPERRRLVESPLASMLYELAETTKGVGEGLNIGTLTKRREIHLLSVTWDKMLRPPEGTPPGLADFLDDVMDATVPDKVLVIGVRLWSSVAATPNKSTLSALTERVTTLLGEDVPDPKLFEADRRRVAQILATHGSSKAPSKEQRAQMESWYNLGRGPDVTIMETPDSLYIGNVDRLEFAVVEEFSRPMMWAPHAQWALSAATHESPAHAISIRAHIEPHGIARNRLRRAQRKALDQIEQDQATQDLDRPENTMTFQLAQELERFVLVGHEPLLTDCSIIMARRVGPEVPDTYIDLLSDAYGIEIKPLEHRQLPALDEMLPCSTKRVNPFPQAVSVQMLAYAGLQGFSRLGDRTGLFTGLVAPDFSPCYTDPLGAPARDLPAGMFVAGDSGSGKTFLLQFLALQAALGGLPVVFVNPKPQDDLDGLAQLAGGVTLNLSSLEGESGFFDPYRFTTPNFAADILISHILTVLGSRGTSGQGLSQEDEVDLTSGIREATAQGARCALQAISTLPPHIQQLIRKSATDPLFRLAIGTSPRPQYKTDGRLLLIQFDRPLDLPQSGAKPEAYSRQERLSVAALRLVNRISLELLASGDGGMLVIDEAWTFLQSAEGRSALNSLGRLGRSQNILPIFASQRIADLLNDGVDMESYISRVLALKMVDPVEQAAALRLVGLEATEDRLRWLADAGPKRGEDGTPGRPAFGLLRDLDNRHSALMVGPIPEDLRLALSTNPQDRKARRGRFTAT